MQKQVSIANKCKERLFTLFSLGMERVPVTAQFKEISSYYNGIYSEACSNRGKHGTKLPSPIIFRSSNDGVSEFSVARATGATLNFEMSRSIAQQKTVLQKHH